MNHFAVIINFSSDFSFGLVEFFGRVITVKLNFLAFA